MSTTMPKFPEYHQIPGVETKVHVMVETPVVLFAYGTDPN